MSYEIDETTETIVEAYPTRRRAARWHDRQFPGNVVVGGLAGALLLLVIVVGTLYLLALHFIVVMMAMVVAATALPLLGVGFIGVKLLQFYNKTRITPVANQGTVFQDRAGNLQIVSPVELFAYEYRNGNAAPVPIELPSPRVPYMVGETIDSYYGPTLSINTAETGAETPIETVPETLVETVEQKHNELEQAKKNLKLVQIQNMREAGISHRTIAAAIGMGGDKYPQYQELCRELGIDTSKK